MSTTISSCAAAPPPLTGGGAPAQSPIQAPVTAGGPTGAPQSPMQVPLQGSAVQGAAGGGALAQPAAPATTPAAPATTSEAPQPAAPVSGGGGAAADMTQVLPALQQVVTTLTALVTQLQGQLGSAQSQAGATGVAGDAGTGSAPVEGGGSPVQQVPSTGCGCAMAAGTGVAQGAPEQQRTDKADTKAGKPGEKLPEAPPLPGGGGAIGDGKLDSDGLTVKGTKMTAEQRKLTETVLRVGKEMGANRKVLETAVATMIQESTIRNDSSVDSKDHDSLGLFQQRPSAGWGTRAQISDPEYAAKKFFEKAIPNDRKKPDQPKTLLAQSVQISAFPNAYAQWDKEAEKIVADYLG